MHKKHRILSRAVWSWLLLLPGAQASWAQAPAPEDFAAHASISDIALAPDGRHLATAVPAESGTETQLHIIPLDGPGGVQVLRFGGRFHVTEIVWSADDRVVVSKANMEPMRATPYSTGELYTTDIRAKGQDMLFGFLPDDMLHAGRRKDEGFADVTTVLRDRPGEVLVAFRPWNRGDDPDETALYHVDTRSGVRREIERLPGPVQFFADHTGRARIAIGVDENDDPRIQYRPTGESEWQPLPPALAGYSLQPMRIAPDNNLLWALASDHKEPAQLYEIDLRAGTRRHLAGRADVAVARVFFQGYYGAPFGALFDAGKPGIEYIDKTSEWTRLHAGLMQRFPGQLVSFPSFSRDDRRVLVFARSDRHPGTYYVLDRQDNSLKLVAELQPAIRAEQMAPVRPVEFESRDGQKLWAFYTARDASQRPLVVMPHGGPHGPYDRWAFDPDAQFLASRGYGVLQVNYRGSGGRGQAFMESGYLEWGGRIQDDIADGVRKVIAAGLAPADRVCIYGGSFGGYSALMNPIRYPELYRCAIGYVGVYDLHLMQDIGDIRLRGSGRRYLDRVLGTDEAVLNAWSPARVTDRIRLPVLLAHGGIDHRVPIGHYRALVKALRDEGRAVESLVIDEEGHGFYKPENRVRLYRAMESFLERSLQPVAAAAPQPGP
jgi:dipeptidyl aminopeptidase/acylaminoacyl peptidase